MNIPKPHCSSREGINSHCHRFDWLIFAVLAQSVAARPCSHSQFYPTREPFANGTRRVARVHTLRPLRPVRPVHSDHIRRCSQWTRTVRVGLALQCECSSGRVGYGSDALSAHVCRLTYFLSTPFICNAANRARRNPNTMG